MNQKTKTNFTSFKKDAASRTLPISEKRDRGETHKSYQKSLDTLRRSPASVFFGCTSLEALALLRNYSMRLLNAADRLSLLRMEADIVAELGDAAPVPF